MELFIQTSILRQPLLNASPVHKQVRKRTVVLYESNIPYDLTVWPAEGYECTELHTKYHKFTNNTRIGVTWTKDWHRK